MIDFEVILPDGWAYIPTTPGLARLRKRIIDGIVRQALPDTLPRDKAGPWRRMLHAELTQATDEAERQGARAVVLPTTEMHGMRLPGTLVLSIVEDDGAIPDPRQVLDGLLADAGADGSALDIGGCPAIRISRIVDADKIKRKFPAVRVSYYIAAPDAPGVWGLLTFTVLTDGDAEAEPVQAIVLLFDMVVSTLRWSDRVDVPTEDELLAG
ncbi:hypothetical protein [Actinoplanes sp. NPDC020271]|uniref:hypothetical protein n=1 Tax=Actinoplanes sp. NPDC020271 TaxID=3363896 RepID=UPI00378A4ED1